LVLKLLQQLFVFLPLRFCCPADSILSAVGALFRLLGAAEKKVAFITSKNHFHHRDTSILAFSAICNHQFPQERAARPLYFHVQGGLSLKKRDFWGRLGPKLPNYYVQVMAVILLCGCMVTPAFALDDMWTVANRIIVDVYGKIAGVSTVLAGLMSAVAVVGAKLSNNQHKVDQAWDWLKRIWIAWMIINGIGAFIAYVTPLFSGLATLTP